MFKKHFETATETETETKRNSFWGREEPGESVECQVMLLDKFIGRPEKHGHLVEFLFCLCHYTIYYWDKTVVQLCYRATVALNC